MLHPIVPSILNETASRQIRLSRTLGDIPMISILSAKREITFDLHALDSFNDPFIYLCVLSFVVVTLIALFTFVVIGHRRQGQGLNIVPSLIRSILRQPTILLNRQKKIRIFVVNFLLLTIFFHIFISYKLLTFFAFKFPVDKIDSIAELADKPGLKVYVFKGGQAYEIFTNPNEKYYSRMKDRAVLRSMIIRTTTMMRFIPP